MSPPLDTEDQVSSPLSSPPESDGPEVPDHGMPDDFTVNSPATRTPAVPVNGQRTADETVFSPDESPVKPQPAASKGKKTTIVVKPRQRSKKWDVDFVLTDPKSLLATADIRAMLLHPLAWDCLNPEDKKELLASFPPGVIIDTDGKDPRPDFQALANDNNFRHDCVRYSENIKEGKHDRQWLSDAWAAHGRHVAGDYDEYLVEKFEKDWGEKLPDELKPVSMQTKIEAPSDQASLGDHDASRVLPDELAGPSEAVASERDEDVVMEDAGGEITVAVERRKGDDAKAPTG